MAQPEDRRLEGTIPGLLSLAAAMATFGLIATWIFVRNRDAMALGLAIIFFGAVIFPLAAASSLRHTTPTEGRRNSTRPNDL